MGKFFTADGKEVEAFSKEELDTQVEAKKTEALAEYVKANPSSKAELDKANADLAAATAKLVELEGTAETDPQKIRLKQERDDAKKALTDLETKLTGEISTLKESIVGGYKTKILDKLSGGDKDLRAKLELEYNGFAGDATDETQITERMTKAYTIVKGTAPQPGFMDGINSGGDRGFVKPVGTPKTTEGQALQKAMGITEADEQKYGPVVDAGVTETK